MRFRMRQNHRTTTPGSLAAVSVETVETPHHEYPGMAIHRLRCWAAYGWRRERGNSGRSAGAAGESASAFWSWLLPRLSIHRPLWLWSHHASADMSALGVWELLETGELCLDAPPGPERAGSKARGERRRKRGVVVASDPPTVLVCYSREGAKLVWVDLRNWILKPLEWTAEAVGKPLPDRPGECATDPDWVEYCRRRAYAISLGVDACCRWVDAADAGNMRWTVASQSMQAFMHWPKSVSPVISDDLEAKARDREAYYTGRCEVFWQGSVIDSAIAGLDRLAGADQSLPVRHDGPAYRLDVTSCYPAAMGLCRVPTELVRTVPGMAVDSLRDWMHHGCAVAEVLIADNNDPWPSRRNGHVVWVTGRVRTALAGVELHRALAGGVVQSVVWSQLYVAGRPFAEFVQRCWRGRLAAGRDERLIERQIWKHLSVSLHGKFGQRRHRWVMRPGESAPVPWGIYADVIVPTGEKVLRRSVAWTVQELARPGESQYSFPAIAAHITAAAREMLREYRLIAGADTVLYEDMDSLHVTRAGYHRLCAAGKVAGEEIGKLKVEKVATVATYRGPRDYSMDDETVCCGLPSWATPSPRGVWAMEFYERLESQLSAGRPDAPVSFDREIARPHHIVKGRVLRDGRVEPLHVKDW